MNVDVQGVEGMGDCEIVPCDELTVDERQCFFAYLHSIETKDAVMPTTFERLVKIVNDAIERSAAMNGSLKVFRTGKGDCVAVLNSDVRIRIVSDSVYIWTKDCVWPTQFDGLLCLVGNVLAAGFVHALPLRGVVSYGKLSFDGGEIMNDKLAVSFHGNGAPHGQSVFETYEVESRMDWSGVVLSTRAEKELRKLTEGENVRAAKLNSSQEIIGRSKFLLWYDVQIGDELEKHFVVNWNRATSRELSQSTIREAFNGVRSSLGKNAEFICGESIRFYEYAQTIK